MHALLSPASILRQLAHHIHGANHRHSIAVSRDVATVFRPLVSLRYIICQITFRSNCSWEWISKPYVEALFDSIMYLGVWGFFGDTPVNLLNDAIAVDAAKQQIYDQLRENARQTLTATVCALCL